MSFFPDHLAALGNTTRNRTTRFLVCYGTSSAAALIFWLLWDRSIGAGALNVIATVQSVVATVLLTVMGSIYSGLPGAVRRARTSRDSVKSAKERTVSTGNASTEELSDRELRAKFEQARVRVLRGLFSHTAVAVVYALASLPIIVAAVQLAEFRKPNNGGLADSVAPWFSLAVLVTASWTIAVVYLVLTQIHRLVMVDAQDENPPPES